MRDGNNPRLGGRGEETGRGWGREGRRGTQDPKREMRDEHFLLEAPAIIDRNAGAVSSFRR